MRNTKRNRFQFGIRSLFFLSLIVGVVAWGIVSLFQPSKPHLKSTWFFGCVATKTFRTDLDSEMVKRATQQGTLVEVLVLTESNAIQLGKKYIESLVDKKIVTSELPSVMAELRNFEQPYKYWLVTFSSNDKRERVDLVVLMDGSVVKPSVNDRLDIGWPLPTRNIDSLSQVPTGEKQFIEDFCQGLNPDRLHAGTWVSLVGTIQDVPRDKHDVSGRFLYVFKSKSGIHLFCMAYDCNQPLSPSNEKVEIIGELVGFRSLKDYPFTEMYENYEKLSWEGLELVPGIRIRQIKHLKN